MFGRRRTTGDFSDEIQAHLDLERDRLIAEGMSPEEAHAAALRAFGNVAIVREQFFETSRMMWFEQLLQDVRYAWRGMRKSPSFVLTAVLTLAIGIGLLTIAFTVFNAYVLRPFAVRHPEELHQIIWHAKDAGGGGFRWRDYEDLRARTDVFSAVIGDHMRFAMSGSRTVALGIVSANFFSALEPAFAIGRGLRVDDVTEPENPAVISYQMWVRTFDKDPAVLGRTIELNGRQHTIVGVLSAAFIGLGDLPRDVFVLATPQWTRPTRPVANEPPETEIFVRLQPGVTAAAAAMAITPLTTGMVTGVEGLHVEIRPSGSPNQVTLELIVVLAPIFAAFALVLVTACANVSNVMLARGIARRRELAVRLSIGASRSRIVRQLLTEGLLIALAAGAVGLVIAAAGLRAAAAALFSTVPPTLAGLLRLAPMPIDYRVFAFTLTASAVATLVFALLPALQSSRLSLTDSLRSDGGTVTRGSRLRNLLVVSQVAVAAVLVIVAATLARNGSALAAVDLGFEAEGVMSINVRGQQHDLIAPLSDALDADPRVADVAVTSGNPLFNQARYVTASAAEKTAPVGTLATFVSPSFFSLLQIPIARGRGFRDDEAREAARVTVISEGMAAALWPREDPIGKTIVLGTVPGASHDALPDYPRLTVVGTVPDIVSGLTLVGRDTSHIYLPSTSRSAYATAILVRGRGAADLRRSALAEILNRVEPDPQVFEAVPLSEMRDLQAYPLVAASWVGALLGVVALILSVTGLYGVLTYTLSQRRKEIGIRVALGATARGVVTLVLRESMQLTAIGAVIGMLLTFGVMRAIRWAIELRAIALTDADPYVTGVVLIVGAAALAAYQPARRAARVDPAEMLRID